MAVPYVIEFDAVGLRYGQGAEVLNDISFALPAGSFHFLTGESGAGKTSLLSLLYLAQSPTRGHVRLFGKAVRNIARDDLPEIRRKIGVVFKISVCWIICPPLIMSLCLCVSRAMMKTRFKNALPNY